MDIRPERPEEAPVIHDLTTVAFAPMSFSDGTEADALDTLRANGDLVLSLVAVKAETIIGHAAFSAAEVGSAKEGWYALGPISVAPELQRTGIGTKLINAGLAHLTELGAAGCVLLGNPDYYNRHGFFAADGLTHRALPPEYVMRLVLKGPAAVGEIEFAPALNEES